MSPSVKRWKESEAKSGGKWLKGEEEELHTVTVINDTCKGRTIYWVGSERREAVKLFFFLLSSSTGFHLRKHVEKDEREDEEERMRMEAESVLPNSLLVFY